MMILNSLYITAKNRSLKGKFKSKELLYKSIIICLVAIRKILCMNINWMKMK